MVVNAMPRFYYQASTPAGEMVKGYHTSDEAVHVRDHLRSQGLLPVWVTEAQEPFWRLSRKRWSLSDRVLWLQQLASLLEARLPLLEALAMLIQQSTPNSPSWEVSQGVYTSVQQGQPLDYALRVFPQYFDQMTLTIVRSGLESGQLPTFMTDLARDWEAKQALRQKMLAAALYPALVGGVSLLMTVGLLFYLTPTLETLFAKRWDQLPWITRMMVFIGKGLRNFWWLWLLLIASSIYITKKQLQKEHYRIKFESFTLKLPGVGSLRILLDCARLAHTLSILLASGISLLKAIEVATPGVALHCVKEALKRIYENVRQGISLSRAFRQESVFPTVLVHWVESGERSGDLGDRLKHAARQLQGEAERRLFMFTSILEPVLILGTGGVVLVLVLSILLPMTSIQQLVK